MSRWTPVRSGHIYCSMNACGRGCTWAEHQSAQRKGRALVKKLGRGWKVRVWENLGWHHSAVAIGVNATVYEDGKRRFWADTHFGDRQFHAYGTSPKAAVKNAVAQAKSVARDLTAALKEWEKR
jgi:hypothetical protein